MIPSPACPPSRLPDQTGQACRRSNGDHAVTPIRGTRSSKPVDPEREGARYLEIKLDISMQLRESRQILEAKEAARQKDGAELKNARHELRRRNLEFRSAFELAASPRDAKLAELNNRIGQIGQEITYLGSIRELSERVAKLIAERDTANNEVDRLTTVIARLSSATSGRIRATFERRESRGIP